jgi:hypothetical protein
MRVKKTRPVIKYVSETTFSPEEEHVHEQVRLALHKPDPVAKDEHARILELLKGHEPIKEAKILPRINENHTSFSKVETPDRKSINNYSRPRKSKSVAMKVSLNSILEDRNEFIKNYFADIYSHTRH